jgi:hypothetical protein
LGKTCIGFCSRKCDKKCFNSCTAQSELPQIFDDFITEEQEVAELGGQANVEVAIKGDENVPTCDELDGNWEQDLYKTVTNKSEEGTIDTASDTGEEERLEVPPVPISECLHLTARVKNTTRELGDEILLDLFNSAECRVEKAIICKKRMSVKQTTLDNFLSKK